MIGVIGLGSWGTALAAALARNRPDLVHVWGRDQAVLEAIQTQHENPKYLPGIPLPSQLKACHTLEKLLDQIQDILVAVPSHSFAELIRNLKPKLRPDHRLLWATKGLEPERGRFLHEVVIELCGPKQIFGVLAGPSFATEVARNLPTAVTLATNDSAFSEALLHYFHSKSFRLYTCQDIIGVQLGGVIKNILALAAGISDGLGLGGNSRAAIMTRGLAEMMRLGLVLGAKSDTLMGLAGVGDVVLTCTDNQSRNKRFGLALAQGLDPETAQQQIGQVVEARHNTHAICRLASLHDVDMPIAQSMLAILEQRCSPRQALEELMARAPTAEAL